MKFSKFGEKFTQKTGILQLMDDLGEALQSDQPVNMLGGGNPASIDAVNSVFLEAFSGLTTDAMGNRSNNSQAIESIANYSSPQGDAQFINALVDFLNRHYDWGLTHRNIALTNGSQNAFFYLFNLLSGQYPDGSCKNILLPLVPEYIGYSDAHIDGQYFTASKPLIVDAEHEGESGFFKYRVDFDALENHPGWAEGSIGAICCSRPTNPTGNMLTDNEMSKLSELAKQHDVPLIIDNAYGLPFPNMVNTPATLHWDANTILCCSLSKIGLPGVRTGIVVADEPIIEAISSLNAIVNLSPTRFGATITTPLLADDTLKALSDEHIQPYYQSKANTAIKLLKSALGDTPMKIHKPEGAMFLWLWFEDLPITTQQLYQQLKADGTIILSSENFFPGIPETAGDAIRNPDAYRHAHECIRMSIAQPDDILEAGINAIGKRVREAYEAS